MLEKVLRHLKNWFVVNIHQGTYEVRNGSIALPFLQEEQYFRIIGSVYNDGLHQYPADDLKDEVFCGVVWAMAVPQEVVELAEEIKGWQEKNGQNLKSPYQSESFGGYSYTKASGKDGKGASWKTVFADELNDWRKVREV